MPDQVCPKCGGRGKYTTGGGGHPHHSDPIRSVTCSKCGGTGRVGTQAPAIKSKAEAANEAKIKKLEEERARLDKEIADLKNPPKKKRWWGR